MIQIRAKVQHLISIMVDDMKRPVMGNTVRFLLAFIEIKCIRLIPSQTDITQ